MALTTKEKAELKKLITIAQKLLKSETAPASGEGGKRIRRTGKQLVQFRKMLKAERKKGTPVAELARKHNISAAYIYQL